MIKFDAGPMTTTDGKACEDEFLIEMHTDRGMSNMFSRSLLQTYFGDNLRIAKINNIIRKYNGYIDYNKHMKKPQYIYIFDNLDTAKQAADAINAVVIAKIL